MYSRRLLSIDPSLTCSGWALFSIDSGRLSAVGKIRSLGPEFPMGTRMQDIQQKITKILDDLSLKSNDVLVCEAQTTMRDPRAAFAVEQVRGIFEALARSREVLVPGRINPRSVHYEVMGLKGAQLPRAEIKAAAVQVVHTLFESALTDLGFEATVPSLTKHQDIVDAILIGNLGLSWIQSAQVSGLSLDEYFESRKQSKRSNGLRNFTVRSGRRHSH